MNKCFVIFFVYCLLIGLVGCGPAGSQEPTPTPLPSVVNAEKVVFSVERGPILSERIVMGEVTPANQEELFFRASGYVTRATVKAGDKVKKGDVIAEMQIDDLLDQLEQSRLELKASENNFQNDTLERTYEIQKAESDVAILGKKVEQSEKQVSRSIGTARDDAQVDLEIAQEQLKTAQAWLAVVKGKQNSYLEQIVQRNQLAVQRLERLLSERQIKAPYDMVVIKSYIYPGNNVEAFQPMFLVGDPTDVAVRIGYDYDFSKILKDGSEAFLSLNESEDDWHLIKFIPNFMPVSDKKEGLEIKDDVPTLNYFYFSPPEDMSVDELPLGGSVNVRIVLGNKPNALLLNPLAIRGTDEFKYVIVLEPDQHRRVEIVEVGLKTNKVWEVVADLKEGDQVLGP